MKLEEVMKLVLERLDRMDSKQDELRDVQVGILKDQADIKADLKIHIKRNEVSEQRLDVQQEELKVIRQEAQDQIDGINLKLDPLTSRAKLESLLFKWAIGLGALAGAATAVLKLFGVV